MIKIVISNEKFLLYALKISVIRFIRDNYCY